MCEASAAVEDLAAQYSPAGTHGPLFCDVAYPRAAPGDIDDPTGATALSALRSGKQARARAAGPGSCFSLGCRLTRLGRALKRFLRTDTGLRASTCCMVVCWLTPASWLRLQSSSRKWQPPARAQLGVGNPGPVDTLTQCLVACESAPGCSAVTYLPAMRNCFLKGCPSRFTVSCPVRAPPCLGRLRLWLSIQH